MDKPEIIHCQDLDQCCDRAAALIKEIARKCVTEKGCFTLVLAGGRTPRQLHARLSEPPLSTGFPWARTFIFWGDERLVAPGDQESNYGMAIDTLLARIPIPAANICPMESCPAGPEEAARIHEEKIRSFFRGRENRAGQNESTFFPRFDLILLGMGPDGHTASLFPDQPALSEKKRWVVPVAYAGASPPVARLTLTLPVLNHGANVMFLVSGPEKLAIMQEILNSPETAGQRYPAALVRPPQGRLLWFTA